MPVSYKDLFFFTPTAKTLENSRVRAGDNTDHNKTSQG